MSIGAGSLEYAQARLAARYGARPDELAWRRIELLRAFPAVVDAARTSALRPWMGGIGLLSTTHDIERVLRGHWRDLVEEVGRWMPVAWVPAVRWCATLVDLPVVQHLARGGAMLPWMREDGVYAELAERESAGFGAAPAGGTLAPLSAAWADPDDIGALWLAEWRRRSSHAGGGDPALREAFVQALRLHFAAFRDPSVRDGWTLRRALQARLALLFRRATADPVAAFIFLALMALDLERLRAELLRRAAFPGLLFAA